MTCFIYYLLDPRNNEVRYVGYTKDPSKRLVDHVHEQADTHKCSWVQMLLLKGLLPELSIRCVVEDATEAKRIEIALIAALRLQGVNLTNNTIGGDGFVGGHHKESTKAKISQKSLASWARDKKTRSLILTTSSKTPEAMAKWKASNTPEVRAKRGAGIKAGWARRVGRPTKKKGRPSNNPLGSLGMTWRHSEETKENYRKSWTPERRAAHAQRMRKRWSK